MASERKWDLDVIRIIACCLVVMIHVLADTGKVDPSALPDWIVYHVLTCAVRCAVPFFFMLSGILFMEKHVPVKQLYHKYIFRIAAALFAWSSFYALIDCMKDGKMSLRYFVIRILSRHYHLWFLPALLGVYICMPLIQKLISACSQELVRYMGTVILVAVIGKVTLDPFLMYFFNTAVWDSFWRDMGLSSVPSGIIFFVLGYYLYKYHEHISYKICLLMAVWMLCLMSALDMYFSLRLGKHTGFTGDLLSIWVTAFSSAVFVLLSKRLSGYKPGERMKRILRAASDSTFGIYLIHVFFLESLYPLLKIQKIPYGFFAVLFSAVLLLVSFCAIWCIRRIPFVRKWIT